MPDPARRGSGTIPIIFCLSIIYEGPPSAEQSESQSPASEEPKRGAGKRKSVSDENGNGKTTQRSKRKPSAADTATDTELVRIYSPVPRCDVSRRLD